MRHSSIPILVLGSRPGRISYVADFYTAVANIHAAGEELK